MSQQSDIQEYINQLKTLIQQKEQLPIIGTKVTLNWKASQLAIISQLTDVSVVNALIILQRQCLKQKIGCFYTYFIMQKAVKNSDLVLILQQQTKNIMQKQSKYHSIKSFIKMREHLLSKINQFSGNQIKTLFEDIDDIRFLNFEIINNIQKWKEQWRAQGQAEPVFYQGNMNYLLKINNDNADMINLANFKKTKFISPPNPFFLSQDGNIQGMSAKQKQDINDCMQFLNKERGIDLRMSVSGGAFIVKNQRISKSNPKNKGIPIAKKEPIELSFVSNAKNQILSVKQEEIRKIYKINRSLQSTKTKANQQKLTNIQIRKISNEQRETEKLKMYSSQKRSDKGYSSQKAIKQNVGKETNVIQAKLNINKIVFPQNNSEVSKASKSSGNNIRSEISRFVKDLQQTQSPIKKKQVRQMKPKIKLIEQKSSVVEDQAKTILNFSTAITRPISRKNSTFYKKIEPIVEQSQDNQMTTTEKQLNKRSLSQSNFHTTKEKKQIIKQNVSKSPQKNLQASILSKDLQSKSQIRNLNNQIKNLTIINIYKGKKDKKVKNNSLSAVKIQQSNVNIVKNNATSFVTQINDIEPKIDSSKYSVAYDKQRANNNNQISKLTQQLEKKSLKSKRNQELLQQRQSKRLQAEKELQLKSMIISQLEQKIKALQNQKMGKKGQLSKDHTKQYERNKKMRQIQSKILKDKIQSEQQKFIANRQLQLRLKQQALKKQLKKNLKELQIQTLKKRKQYQKQIIEQQKRMKQTQKQIIKQKNKYKEIENELQQKRLKEKLLRRIMQQKQESVAKQYESQIQVQKALQMEKQLRQKMELQSLQLLQNEKKKMEELYESMIQKNKRIQEQNQRKIKQLNELDQKRASQLQKMKKMEEDFQKMVKKEQDENAEAKKQPEKEEKDIQALKFKLKKELLEEIIAKNQRQQEQERQQEERRRERLKKIQLQVANALRQEEQALQRQNAQFLKKIQHLKQISLIPTTHQNEEESKEPEQQQQNDKQQMTVIDHPINDFTLKGQENKEPVTFQLKPKQSQNMNNIDEQIKQLQQAKEEKIEEKLQSRHIITENKQYEEPIQKKQTQKQETLPSPTKLPIQQSQSKQQSIKRQSLQPEKTNQKELEQKYKNLSKFFKKTKTITLQSQNISHFLDSFLNSLQKTMRQMLPWNKFDLQRIISTKKADAFEHNSLGWLQQSQKYYLIGGFDCIQSIVKKYGNIQIHQVFIFDKTNPYQKQFLTKKMKVFESIGYVFKKNMPQSNKYSIRFVIKFPKKIMKSQQKQQNAPIKSSKQQIQQ